MISLSMKKPSAHRLLRSPFAGQRALEFSVRDSEITARERRQVPSALGGTTAMNPALDRSRSPRESLLGYRAWRFSVRDFEMGGRGTWARPGLDRSTFAPSFLPRGKRKRRDSGIVLRGSRLFTARSRLPPRNQRPHSATGSDRNSSNNRTRRSSSAFQLGFSATWPCSS